MNIRNERDVNSLLDCAYGAGAIHIVYGRANNLTAGLFQRKYLRGCCCCIPRIRIGHGLYADRRAAADGHIPHPYAARLFHTVILPASF
jgi:hypothetical protein